CVMPMPGAREGGVGREDLDGLGVRLNAELLATVELELELEVEKALLLLLLVFAGDRGSQPRSMVFRFPAAAAGVGSGLLLLLRVGEGVLEEGGIGTVVCIGCTVGNERPGGRAAAFAVDPGAGRGLRAGGWGALTIGTGWMGGCWTRCAWTCACAWWARDAESATGGGREEDGETRHDDPEELVGIAIVGAAAPAAAAVCCDAYGDGGPVWYGDALCCWIAYCCCAPGGGCWYGVCEGIYGVCDT
ncbi:hypothetical protein B0H34DRAFT_714082, partial [Crassisporium funariophilum]